METVKRLGKKQIHTFITNHEQLATFMEHFLSQYTPKGYEVVRCINRNGNHLVRVMSIKETMIDIPVVSLDLEI